MKFFSFLIPIFILFFVSCENISTQPNTVSSENISLQYKDVLLELQYTFGTYSGSYGNSYAIWIESDSFIRPLAISERLLGKGAGLLANLDALPFWHLNKLPLMAALEIDAVTGPTLKNQSFNTPFLIAKDDPHMFTIYFETDVSFNSNDYFPDQPSIVYSATVNLKDNVEYWDLALLAWTPHEGNLTTSKSVTKNNFLIPGALVQETRFITNKINGMQFGDIDSQSQTCLVGNLRLIKK